jgi:hypothetical protein
MDVGNWPSAEVAAASLNLPTEGEGWIKMFIGKFNAEQVTKLH